MSYQRVKVGAARAARLFFPRSTNQIIVFWHKMANKCIDYEKRTGTESVQSKQNEREV